MGLFGKLFKKAPAEQGPRQEVSMPLEEFDAFLEKESRPLFEELEKKAFSKFSEIKHSLSELSSLLQQLKEKKVHSEQGNKRLRKIVATSKQNMQNQLASLLKKLEPPSSHEFEVIRGYSLNSNSLLESEAKIFGKSIAYTGIILKEEIKEIGKVFSELKDSFAELKQLFEENKRLEFFSESRKQFSELKSMLKEVEALEAVRSKQKSEASALRKKLEGKKTEAERVRQDPEFKKIQGFSAKKKALLDRKNALKTKLLEFLAPLDKPLKRFNKLVQANQFILDENQKGLLGSYTSNPFLALKRDPSAAVLKSLLSQLKELIEDGTIALKDKEKEKKLASLNEMLSFDFFENVFWEFNKLESEMNALEKSEKESAVMKKLASIERSASETEKEFREQQLLLEEQEKRIESMNEQISKKKELLEHSASELLGKNFSFTPPEKK